MAREREKQKQNKTEQNRTKNCNEFKVIAEETRSVVTSGEKAAIALYQILHSEKRRGKKEKRQREIWNHSFTWSAASLFQKPKRTCNEEQDWIVVAETDRTTLVVAIDIAKISKRVRNPSGKKQQQRELPRRLLRRRTSSSFSSSSSSYRVAAAHKSRLSRG